MADIFISYANEDREAAAQLAGLLESVGWHVWWDRRIPAGRTWRSMLEEALKDMRCMIVLWSQQSVNSPWVAEEAEEARKLGKMLVPVLIQRVEPPIGFRAIQAADLVNWDGTIDDPAARMFIADLKSLLNAPLDNSDKQSRVFESRKIESGSSIFQWLMIGIRFGGSATENSKLSPATFRRPAFETLKSAAEGTDWPLSPIWIGQYPIT